MKKLREMRRQLTSGLLMLAISIPLLLVALSVEEKVPTLAFEGLQMEMQADGSVRVLVDVYIQHLEDSDVLPAGARFSLRYNREYMTPSDFDSNEALANGASADLAFHYDEDLYQVFRDTDGDGKKDAYVHEYPFMDANDLPFLITGNRDKVNLNIFDSDTEGHVVMNLVARRDTEPDSRGIVLMDGGRGEERVAVFSKTGKIHLGTLSFRIEPENVGKLPELTRNFDKTIKDPDPRGKEDEDKRLLWYKTEPGTSKGLLQGDWSIVAAYQVPRSEFYSLGLLGDSIDADKQTQYNAVAESHFTFHIPRLVMDVELVEPELTVDAYQAYTTGHISDLDIVLQKYSPAVLVKYSDGTQENVILPWGRTTTPWTASKVIRPWREGQVDWDDTTDVIKDADYYGNNYCTEGDYKVQKLYCYTEKVNGVEVQKVFPIPLSVHLTVTPITLIDVTADDLYRVYPLNADLVGDGGVQNLGELDLPSEARLITDRPAGGATLTMTIPGWSHNNGVGDGGATVYWPFIPDGAGTPNIGDLRRDSATSEYHHWPVEQDLSLLTELGWATPEGADTIGENRSGLYTFKMSESYGGAPVAGFSRTEIKTAYPWLTVPDCNKLPGDKESWPIDDALRRIVWEGDTTDKKLVDRNEYEVTYQSTIANSKKHPELFLPDLTLQVRKRNVNNNETVHLPDTSIFRVKLPDGTEMGTYVMTADVTIYDWFTDTEMVERDEEDNPVANYNGKYVTTPVDLRPTGTPDAVNAYDLTTNPGRTTLGSFKEERERLLRYINLGGWFSVSVNEDPDAYYWSDFIPVYVPPRENVHLEDKVYNFIGENADLYRFVNWDTKAASPVFPTTVTLPAGSYETVDDRGVPNYDEERDSEGELISRTRHQERYGVKTLYSGVTGAQFGELNTFSIQPSAWTKSSDGVTATGGEPITKYGADDFRHKGYYGVYNYVYNPGLELYDDAPPGATEPDYKYQNRAYTATIRTQNELKDPPDPDDPNALREGITLTYEGPPGGVTDGADGNVDLVTFNTRVEGYTVRQEYTLVITNVGDIDIYGLSIDMLTDKLDELQYQTTGGNFSILKPPASFLPAGERTTFTLSYVYDLRGGSNGGELEYLDKLYITSDNKHTVGPGTTEGTDYLLNFDAEFRVSSERLHQVLVEYEPSDGCMGTAQVIVGEIATSATSTVMNINAGSSAATKGSWVYVMATPTDEYEVTSATARDSNGSLVDLAPWSGTITLADGTTVNVDKDSQIRIWHLVMPNYDVTVHIKFEEPISSKLRLSELKAYASHNSTYLYDDDAKMPLPIEDRKPYEYAVWQKGFTEDEYKDAAKIHPDVNDPSRGPTEEERDRYLMQYGTVTRKGYNESVNQYLVVVPFEADYSQIEAILRQVPYTLDGANPNLPRGTGDSVKVEMTWFPEEAGPDVDPDVDPFNYPLTAANQIYLGAGDTSVPTVHTSRAFNSPTPGYSNYVRIEVNYSSTEVNVSRYYFVEIHRMPKEPVAELNYGNSPYGMIMNATNITAADKAAAKKAFVDNKYSFDGLDDKLVPRAVKEADRDAENDFIPVNAFTSFSKLHYWTEAWVAPDAKYEPESHMGFSIIYNSDDKTWTWVPDANIYKVENNLDLSDTAFFAIIGEDFQDPGLRNVLDSTGRPGRIGEAVLSLEVYTLDDTAATQTERFALPADPNSTALNSTEKADLAARTLTLSRKTAAGSRVSEWSSLTNTQGKYLRPGRYQLVYTLPDFDYDDYMATPEEERDPNHDPTLKVVRDFVVLAPVGDVNADMPSGENNANGYVSDAIDEALVKGRITEPLGYMGDNYPDGAIFKLRTCDVNNDRNINNIDANTIRVDKCVKRYYLPIDYKK